MNMKKITCKIVNAMIALGILVSMISFSSCDSFLSVDKYFEEMTQLDSIFKRKEWVDQYIRGAARYLPNEGDLWYAAPNPFQGASDENFSSWDYNTNYNGIHLLRDEVTEYSNYFLNYAPYYEGIRKANIVLQRIHEVQDIMDIDRRDFMGRCYFLKGYYAYLLLIQYGPVPLVSDDPFAMSDEVDKMSLERGTYDECVEYICHNMELAYQLLPEERQAMAELNIPDRGAALAVMSRVTLTAASPWYNGNEFYAGWTRASDGAYYISQQADNSKWGQAAVAAKRVMDMGKYRIYFALKENSTPALPANVSTANFPDGAGNIDPFMSYTHVFNGELPRSMNPEIIYSCSLNAANVMSASTPPDMGGSNGLNLTQDVVDAFYMADGRDINSSSLEIPYPALDERHERIGKDTIFSGYRLVADAAKMYANREVRFYATIGFCEAFWPGTSYTGTNVANLVNQVVQYYADGKHGAPDATYPDNYNHTGYTCKKYIHGEDNRQGTVRAKAFPIIRYAEILLNYAEALNELGGESYTDPELGIIVTRDWGEIRSAFNQIRYRAGLPGLDTDPGETEMRRLIKRERQIEFVCEGRRYHDLRRWGDAYEAYNRPVIGLNIKARTSERKLFYTPIILSNDPMAYRIFDYKHYFYPIPKNSLNKNPKLVQGPGW